METIQLICEKFPKVTEEVKWETHICYCIGGKIFIITNPDSSPVTASFKVDEEDFNSLQERDGFTPAPYLARYKWIHVDDINRLSKKEWQQYLQKAYELVRDKLPARIKKQIGV